MDRHVRDEELLADVLRQTRRSVRDVQRPTGTEKARTTEVAQEAWEKAGQAGEAADAVGRVPEAVSGLAVVSNIAGWGTSAEATVTLSWSAVTTGVDGEPVECSYELFDGDFPAWSGTATQAAVKIISGSVHDYCVRAVSVHGVPGDLSDAVAVTGATPAMVPLVPKSPTLTSSLGVVVASWGGEYTTAAGAGALSVRMEARVEGGAWKQQGAALTAAGDQAVGVGATGDTVEVRLVAVDRLGRDTGTSSVASITVTGVSVGDLGSDVAAVIENAETLADRALLSTNGLNRIIPSYAHPGDGWIGAGRNLAPAIVGDGTWAEVRRNLLRTRELNAINGAGATLTPSTSLGRPGSIVTGPFTNTSTTGGYTGPFTGGEIIGASVRLKTLSSASAGLQVDLRVHAGSGFTGPAIRVTLPSLNHEVTVKFAPDMALDSSSGLAPRIFLYSVGGATSYNFWAGELLLEQVRATGVVPGKFFDGSTMDMSMPQPEDFRVRWTGAENASESVMEIERVAGWQAYSANGEIVGVSKRLHEGAPTLRVISSVSAAGTNNATGARAYLGTGFPHGRYTGTATYLIDEPAGLTVSTRIGPNLVGYNVAAQEVTVGPVAADLTPGNLYISPDYWGKPGPERPDMWVAKIGLYAGDPDMPDHLRLHNGDTWWELDETETSIVRAHMWNGQVWVPHRFVADTIIAAGSITAPLIRAGEIQTDHLSPAVGGQLNLSANESIVFIAGRQDQQDNDLAGVQEQLDTVADEATAAAEAAAAADAAAQIADGKALVAGAQAQDTSDRLNTQQAVFRVTPTGADVASKDGSNIVRITPTGVAIVQGGTPASTWDAGRLIVSEAIVSRAQIGNHIIEKQGTRTTFRPL